jgi:hypothetical protein
MTDRRRTDPEGCTEGQARSNGLEIGYKGLKLNAKGFGVYLALAVVGIVGSNLYAGYRTEQAIVAGGRTAVTEHAILRTTQDRTACIVAMTPEERTRFRERFQPGAFKQMCPWMDE